ncbi:MAG: hypothetical protein WC744_02205 [Patescibacteria group bacterium]|jgi:hypothetical protein
MKQLNLHIKLLPILRKYIPYFLLAVVVLSMIFLIISIVKSAYYYQYDSDEFYHVQRAYLIALGLKPYTSFFFFFSSIFHRALIPVLLLFGFSFATLGKIRIFMVLLFAVRVTLTVLFINKVFNRRTALLFIPLFLFDPFTVFSSMQIRPDNLMMIFYILGFLIFVIGFFKSSKPLLFLSGTVFGLSFLTLIKITPQLATLFVIYGIYCVLNREFKNFILLLDGFVLSVFLFCLYHLFNGSFFSMIEQVFIFSFSLPSLMTNQVPYGFFHQPNNGFIYGLMGKPLTWAYVWVLPLLASAGAYLKLKNINNKKQLVQVILVVGLVVQYLFLLNLSMVFIQYYIPFQWLLALFAAVMLEDLIFNKFPSGFFHQLFKSGLFIIFLILVYVSVQANNARTVFRSEPQISQFAPIWSKVPQNAAIFPSILFRPIAYPLSVYDDQLNNFDTFSSVKNTFPKHIDSFEKNKVPYLVIDDPIKFYTLEPGLDKYIENHYQKIDSQINLYKRVK